MLGFHLPFSFEVTLLACMCLKLVLTVHKMIVLTVATVPRHQSLLMGHVKNGGFVLEGFYLH